MSDRVSYSVAEIAEMTGISRPLLYDEMNAGRLGFLKIGRRRIITRRQLAAFLAMSPVELADFLPVADAAA
jgi:excisionase family DNA binding protein